MSNEHVDFSKLSPEEIDAMVIDCAQQAIRNILDSMPDRYCYFLNLAIAVVTDDGHDDHANFQSIVAGSVPEPVAINIAERVIKTLKGESPTAVKHAVTGKSVH